MYDGGPDNDGGMHAYVDDSRSWRKQHYCYHHNVLAVMSMESHELARLE